MPDIDTPEFQAQQFNTNIPDVNTQQSTPAQAPLPSIPGMDQQQQQPNIFQQIGDLLTSFTPEGRAYEQRKQLMHQEFQNSMMQQLFGDKFKANMQEQQNINAEQRAGVKSQLDYQKQTQEKSDAQLQEKEKAIKQASVLRMKAINETDPAQQKLLNNMADYIQNQIPANIISDIQPKQKTPSSSLDNQVYQDFMDKNPGATPAQAQAYVIKNKKQAELNAEADQYKLTPEALKDQAERYNQTGKLPPMGMSKASYGARIDILNEATKQLKAQGLDSVDAIVSQLKLKTTTQALGQLQKVGELSKSYEQTANNYFNTLLELRKEVSLSGIKSVGQLQALVQRQVTGDPATVALADQIWESMLEYGKVASGNLSIAGATDAANAAAQKLITAADKEETYEKLIGPDGIFRKNMRDRNNSIDDTYNNSASKIGLGLRKPSTNNSTDFKNMSTEDLFRKAMGK